VWARVSLIFSRVLDDRLMVRVLKVFWLTLILH
jgi:hypothetical protein